MERADVPRVREDRKDANSFSIAGQRGRGVDRRLHVLFEVL